MRTIERQRQSNELLAVGVAQPNISIADKHDRNDWARQADLLRSQTKTLKEMGARVVIWPETAYPFGVPTNAPSTWPGFGKLSGWPGVSLLMGTIRRGRGCERYNSAVALDRQHRLVGHADKIKLLAFGEYVPFWNELTILQDYFRCPGISAGNESKALVLEHMRFGVLNCYEDVLPEFARYLATNSDPGVFVNLTNDAWFGDTTEPRLHEMIARWRSIETRRDMVRAVNTGVSSHISATGRLIFQTPTYVRREVIANVRSLHIQTHSVRYGDWGSLVLYFWLVVVTMFARRRYPRARYA